MQANRQQGWLLRKLGNCFVQAPKGGYSQGFVEILIWRIPQPMPPV